MKLFGSAGAIGLLLGVALGSFGAHSLRGHLDAEELSVFETGVRYQMYHSLALLAVSFFYGKGKWFHYAGWSYILGIVLFSGSLYVLAFTGISAFGYITPAGGTCFLAGHILLLAGFLKL